MPEDISRHYHLETRRMPSSERKFGMKQFRQIDPAFGLKSSPKNRATPAEKACGQDHRNARPNFTEVFPTVDSRPHIALLIRCRGAFQ